MNRNMMRQMQQLQSKMEKLQEELGEMTMDGTAGGGAVKVVVDGHQNVRSVEIAAEVVDPAEVEMLQEMVLGAVTDAMEKSKKIAADKMAPLTGGMNIPGM